MIKYAMLRYYNICLRYKYMDIWNLRVKKSKYRDNGL